jgi:hypothetical protein
MKKTDEQSSYPDGYTGDEAIVSKEEMQAMAKYHWTDEIPPNFEYNHDVRRADMYYNIM